MGVNRLNPVQKATYFLKKLFHKVRRKIAQIKVQHGRFKMADP